MDSMQAEKLNTTYCIGLDQKLTRLRPYDGRTLNTLLRFLHSGPMQAGTLVLLMFGAGGAGGVVLGGALGQWLYNKRKVRGGWPGHGHLAAHLRFTLAGAGAGLGGCRIGRVQVWAGTGLGRFGRVQVWAGLGGCRFGRGECRFGHGRVQVWAGAGAGLGGCRFGWARGGIVLSSVLFSMHPSRLPLNCRSTRRSLPVAAFCWASRPCMCSSTQVRATHACEHAVSVNHPSLGPRPGHVSHCSGPLHVPGYISQTSKQWASGPHACCQQSAEQ